MARLVVILSLMLLCRSSEGIFFDDLFKAADVNSDPEVDMNLRQLVAYSGYPYEEHWATTEDGYILYMIRITGGRNQAAETQYSEADRPVVLFQHGLSGNADSFVLNPPDRNLPYLLADSGVDVWMANSRGTTTSKNHTTLDPNTYAFWQFSWDQMAQYDLPAEINHILNTTGKDQIYYVGHSQGTAIGFAAFSENPELASHIKHFLAFAPIGRVGHSTSGLRSLMPYSSLIQTVFNTFYHGAISQSRILSSYLSHFLCTSSSLFARECENLLFFLVGDDASHFNQTRMPVYIGHEPDTMSVRTLLQWAQGVKSGQFQKFDYGNENFNHYGQHTPPLYNVQNMKVPVAIFRGGKDVLADPTDVAWLMPQLNVTHDVNIPYYNHMTMFLSYDAKYVVFPTAIEIITGKPANYSQ